MKLALLGGLDARTFLRRHWQKRPLFVRGALERPGAIVDKRTLFSLASRNDVESRIVTKARRRRSTEHGPFDNTGVFPKRNATLLVSGVNLHVRAAERLLRRFDFIPQARLDDVMVSYAEPGGGVGPHVDSYDVFLIQGPGRRRWIFKDSNKKQVVVCEPGDLLYLPPGVKHDGVALEPCYTYSVGFRAPRGRELAARFLDWLHERGLPDALYRDPNLRAAARPAAIPREMAAFAARTLGRIAWTEADVARFLGSYLSEPKAHVVFRPSAGAARLERSLVELDAKTQLLYRDAWFFLNGEAFALRGREARLLRELADRRGLDGKRAARSGLRRLVYDWRRAGFLHFRKPPRP
ncbi:MAG: cupin domain-containing protein [Betaproteobacteria bacterium]|nr:cupin domain-containing protein [Betaproteobacteria bacterium]